MGVLQSGKKMASSVSNKPRFNFIEDTFLNANGVSTKLWTLPESDLHSALNEEYNDVSTLSHGIVYREFGCGVNPRAHVHSISRPQHLQNRKKISFGLNLRSSCKLNYLRRRQRLAHGKKLAAPSIPNKPLFNFIEDTFLNACGVSTKFLTLPAADLHSALNEEYKDGSPPSPRILNEKICIGTKSFNSAIGDVGAVPSKEQKELLFRSIANLLSKSGLSKSAHLLMQEAKIKEGGVAPPDIEGFLLEFLKKGESYAQEEKLKLNELASSLKMLSLSLSHETCDQEDVDIFSKYTSEDSEVSKWPVDFLCDQYRICIKCMHKRTLEEDVVKFFKKASIEVESVKLDKPERNFRNVLQMSCTVWFKSPEDTKKAADMNGTYMKIKKKNSGGSFVYMSRFSNAMRVLCVSGFKGDLSDDDFLQKELKRLSNSCSSLKIVSARPVADYDVCYVLVEATTKKVMDLLQGLNGSQFMGGGLFIREAYLKPNVFEYLFQSRSR